MNAPQPTPSFSDRRAAGRSLAERLLHYAGRSDIVVLALPRGGVPVGYEVARRLAAPLGVFVVRKLGMPGREELAIGAIATGGVCILDQETIAALRVPPEAVEAVIKRELRELERREHSYAVRAAAPSFVGRIVILVDDGLATGASMRAAAIALRSQGPARIVVAVPVGSREACREFQQEVDEAICGIMPEPFYGVGMWYADFSQTSDEEVRELLERSSELRLRPQSATAAGAKEGLGHDRES